MFFHFQLAPLAEVLPWGQKDDLRLHWFGLSDGHYWIQIGETELFRYSEAALALDLLRNPALANDPLRYYVDYQVVRLWEDILEIVPDVLGPLPPELLQRMEPVDQWLAWSQKVDHWRWQMDEQEEEQEPSRSVVEDPQR